jgi:hypothetical protein
VELMNSYSLMLREANRIHQELAILLGLIGPLRLVNLDGMYKVCSLLAVMVLI